MAQVFGSRYDKINEIQEVFQRMVNAIPDPNHAARGGAVLRLAMGDNIKMDDGRTKLCGAKTSPFAVYAVTYNPTPPETDLQKKYQRLADAIIIFYPTFFSDLEDDSTLLAESPMLDRLRTRGTQHIAFGRLDHTD